MQPPPQRARPTRSLAAEKAFRARLDELGAELLESAWLGSLKPHHVVCAADHDCYPRPHGVQQGQGICRVCAGNEPAVAEARFRARIEELGATLLEPKWLGANRAHHVRCANGHDCWSRPAWLRDGGGLCRVCGQARNQSRRERKLAAEVAFRIRLAELGATPLYGEYLGVNAPHHVRCAAGHDCWPHPAGVQQGCGICRACVRHDPVTAEMAFRRRLGELGAELLEPYQTSNAPHHVRCAAGHDCYPRPDTVRDGHGICRTCAGLDPARAAAAFAVRVADLGATQLGPYVNAATPVHVRCAAGHDCRPYPSNVRRGSHVCRLCAHYPAPTAEAAFRARLAELGAELLEPYVSANRAHHVRCKAGHDCWPRPAQVRDGGGICRTCAGKTWDVFYVVTHERDPRVKFGISNMTGRARLGKHRSAGYRTVVRLLVGLPDGAALGAERAVKSALAMAGEKPVHGREYFDVSCLGLILDVADSWLSSTPVIKVAAAVAYVQEVLF